MPQEIYLVSLSFVKPKATIGTPMSLGEYTVNIPNDSIQPRRYFATEIMLFIICWYPCGQNKLRKNENLMK